MKRALAACALAAALAGCACGAAGGACAVRGCALGPGAELVAYDATGARCARVAGGQLSPGTAGILEAALAALVAWRAGVAW